MNLSENHEVRQHDQRILENINQLMTDYYNAYIVKISDPNRASEKFTKHYQQLLQKKLKETPLYVLTQNIYFIADQPMFKTLTMTKASNDIDLIHLLLDSADYYQYISATSFSVIDYESLLAKPLDANRFCMLRANYLNLLNNLNNSFSSVHSDYKVLNKWLQSAKSDANSFLSAQIYVLGYLESFLGNARLDYLDSHINSIEIDNSGENND